jgi:pimeloyl-ACP methyl ester carboxylesterase
VVAPRLSSVITYVELPDGRRLEVLVPSERAGVPILFHGGLPSAVASYPPFDAAAGEAGGYLVTYSRPGYGRSTPWPDPEGVRVVDDVADCAAILDHLAIEEFATIGWSGGGPRSLACAARLGDRCLAAATLAGLAPVGAGGMTPAEWFEGMGPENVRDFQAGQKGVDVLRPLLEEQAEAFSSVSADDVVAAFGGLLSEVDARALTGEFAGYVAEMSRRAFEQGIAGILPDALAVEREWGFDLDEIDVPVAIWQGRQDKMVPFGHGEWLRQHVPTARTRLFDHEGHVSLVVQMPPILSDLVSMARGSEVG